MSQLRRVFRVYGLLLGTASAVGCADVAYFEKRELGRRVMQFDSNELEVAYQNKVLAAREVSGGRPGHSAGGGCGCGN